MTMTEKFFNTMYEQGVINTISFSYEKKIIIFTGDADFKYFAMDDAEIEILVNLCFNCGINVKNADEGLKFKIVKQEE